MGFISNNPYAVMSGGVIRYESQTVPIDNSMINDMRDDMDEFLEDWGQTLTIYRKSSSYDSTNKATITWNNQGDFIGDWQPIKGDAMIEKDGEMVHIDSLVETVYNVDIDEGDKVQEGSEHLGYVFHVKRHEDHMVIYLRELEGQE